MDDPVGMEGGDVRRSSAPPPVERLHRTLARLGEPVERRETHGSWVLLTPRRAYKLKKPVRFPFADLSSPSARRRACEEEVRVNAPLAPDVVRGVVGLAPSADRFAFVEPDAPEAVDWVVEMRRFDEGRTLAALIRRGAVDADDVAAVARRIARFHDETERCHTAAHAGETLRGFDGNLTELASLGDAAVDGQLAEGLARFAEGFAARHRGLLDRRGRDGLVRDGHGDLRAEHVLLEDGGVTIVDRIEFDAALRRVDVADDLAFLAMDLEMLGDRAPAVVLVQAYRAEGGDTGPDELVAFFGVHRALVRAKVRLLRARQQPAASAGATADRREAAGFARLAERLAWRARGRHALLVHGPPASGKSHLSAALAERSGMPIVSTDAVRKERLGLRPEDRAPAAAYGPAERRAVYAEVGRRARRALRDGSVIVDATLGDPAARSALFAALAPDLGRLLAIRCTASRETLRQRALERSDRPSGGSDAGPAEVERLAAAFAPLSELEADRILVVATDVPTDDPVARIAAWLDGEEPNGAVP